MNNLIIIEGLPCSGKSTTAEFIAGKLGAKYFDEDCGNHPADYEYHAFIDNSALDSFSENDHELIRAVSIRKVDGFIVPLRKFTGDLLEKLLQYKIYDGLPWETERPVMLDKWHEFVNNARHGRYVFNCVLLQNPMCETMMRFGFEITESARYIGEICNIIAPLDPFVVYLRCSKIRPLIEKAIPERGNDWLNAVIDYHCKGGYGKKRGLSGFEGYISALEERQRREVAILESLKWQYLIIDDPANDWGKTYVQLTEALK